MRTRNLTTAERDAIRAAMSSDDVTSADLVLIEQFGCSVEDGNGDPYSNQTMCLANGGDWVAEKAYTTFDQDLETSVKTSGVFRTINFKASSELKNVEEYSESTGITVTNLNIQLNANEGELLHQIQTYETINKRVEVWRVFLDSTNNYSIIGKPIKWFSGYLTKPSIVESEESGAYINLELSNFAYDYERRAGIVCNVDSHQKAHSDFANDTGFKFCTSEEVSLPWLGNARVGVKIGE